MEQNQVILTETIIRDIEELVTKLDKFLILNGIVTDDKKFLTIVEAVNHLRTINPNKKYISLIKDRNGYVVGFIRTNDIIDEQTLPEDFIRGYYSITENGEIELDELQKMKLMEV